MEFVALIISTVLYFLSPENYSLNFCIIILVLYLFSFYRISKFAIINGNYINFTLFFSVSFFFVNFFYPVFLYPFNKEYFTVFERFLYNENVISKATALALVGYNSFVLAQKMILKKLKQKHKKTHNRKLYDKTFYLKRVLKYSYPFFVFISISSILLLFMLGIDGILKRSHDAFFEVEPFILVICQCVINLQIIILFYLKKSLNHLLVPILYSLMFLYVGDRGPAIQTLLLMVFCYNFFRNTLSKKSVIVIILSGFVVMTLISSIRGREGTSKTISSVSYSKVYDFAMDLIINNRNLYAGYEYAERNGINYGKSSFIYIFAPIPGLPTYMSEKIFNVKPNELSTGVLLTNQANAGWGLGTNLIADLYMQFNFLGVFILMFVLGYVVKKLEISMQYSFVAKICYLFICTFSIYMPRSTLFDSVRYIAWALFIYYFIYYLLKPVIKIKNKNI